MGNTTQALGSVSRPAETIMIAEKHDPTNTSDWGMGCLLSGVNWWDAGYSPGEIPDGLLPSTNPYPTGPNGAVWAGHNLLSNFAFCDGHVKAMYPIRTNPDPIHQPQNNMWNALR